MIAPTERQLAAIAIIEKKLQSVKFTGTTRKEASAFISKYMETSKHTILPHRRRLHWDDRQQEVAPSRPEKSDHERYEKYIEEVSWNYVEAAGDDGWGGLASRAMARQLHPFEQWKHLQ